MAGLYPWGVANTGTTGTMPEGVQGIMWSMYAGFGLLAGCEITGNTGMSVTVKAGAGIVEIGNRRAVMIAVPEQTLTLTAAPASGSRTDVIYARADTGQVHVAAGGSGLPAQHLAIGTVVVPAGATSGTACQIPADRNWAVPSGSTRLLYSWTSTMSHAEVLPDTEANFGEGSFYVPQDQRLLLTFSAPWRSRTAGARNAYIVGVYIDNVLRFSWRVGVGDTGDTGDHTERLWVTAGRHTVRLRRRKILSNGVVEYVGGGPDKVTPARMRIEAAGITA